MTKRITKKQFLLDVRHEIDMLKLHATDAEKARLDFDRFDYTSQFRCIYGQLTGNCDSKRAKELMDLACVRVMHLGSSGVHELDQCDITDLDFKNKINGKYTGQTWEDKGWSDRSFHYLSALEGYIATKGAKNEAIIEYIKGNTDKLKL